VIASLRGRVAAVTLSAAVVEVGGVGLKVLCTPATLASLRLGAEATLATTLVVREDSLTLFGFSDTDERDMFELVQTASGVGPKVAQALLAVHDPDSLRVAVAGEDIKALTRVPGIGPKGAQRIVLELKDRIGAARGGLRASAAGAPVPASPWRQQLVEALVGLGWSTKEADRAVDAVSSDVPPGGAVDVAALLKSALQRLSRA
jgi:Holliday junction DNA helicase RuvA